MEDWYLVRNSAGHVGWVLLRMVDLDIPLEVAQYAEGQRIVGYFVLNTVQDGDKQVPQYLVLLNEPKDGLAWDYNQIRSSPGATGHHRYETAYRERNLEGYLPVKTGHQEFGKEGDLPTFTIRKKNDDGQMVEITYKLNGPIVRRVLTPEEEAAEKAKHQAAPHYAGTLQKQAPDPRATRSTSKIGALAAVELRNRCHHALLLVFAQLGEHGQRQHFFGGALRLRQIAGLVSQIGEALLQMQRNGIVNLGADTLLGQETSQLIAPPRADHVLMVDVIGLGKRRQQRDRRLRSHGLRAGLHQPRIRQQPVIAAGQHAALLVPVVKVL